PSSGGSPGGGDPSGGGDPGSGGGPGGGGSDFTPDDGSTGSGRGAHPGTGGDYGPHFPGGPLGTIFDDLGVTSGGEDGVNEGSGIQGIVAGRLRKVIGSANDASSSGDGGNDAGQEGSFAVDVVVPVPPSVIDDWGDRPNPRAMTAIIAL